ncbi:MAG TPA: hypothetical protein VNZ64_17165 [Candidatus Acidoferrum sp.]|jgi:hypothetical protein|nr:hypothetical protein [Candidatus Acidoferrum sp.]
MKPLPYLLIASSLLFSPVTRAAETAQARMYCLSFKVYQAPNGFGDYMKINSTASDPGAWEVSPSQTPDSEITLPGVNSYGSGFWFWDNTYQYYTDFGTLYLNPPDFTDLNTNKFPDFFEVALGVSGATSTGSYTYHDSNPNFYGDYSGNIFATWNRTAGSKTGTVSMQIVDTVNGNYWDTMIGVFEILEYKGTLSYTPSAASVSGTLNLTQTGSNATFTGSAQWVKSATNRFNSLIIQPGILTDASAQANYFTNRYFFRDANWPTNYAGYVQFDNDGDIGTFYPYAVWVLSINDTNDANHNGIPDFSDDAAVAPPRQPLLGLAATPTNFLLSVSGDINHVVKIQQRPNLAAGSWADVTSFTLTNPTVVVPLTPSGAITFWRVQAQ